MIPVKQTISDAGNGDCFRAAVASLLDLNITQVPHFIIYEDWFGAFVHFLKFFDIEYEGTGRTHRRTPAESDAIDGLIIATVPSLNFEGKVHSVLIDISGVVVHDPSTGASWQGNNVLKSGDLRSWNMLKRACSVCNGTGINHGHQKPTKNGLKYESVNCECVSRRRK